MKKTIWEKIPAEECEILDVQRGEYTGKAISLKINHPILRRARWFTVSQNGNFYSRYTGGSNDAVASGYIITGNILLLNNGG